MKVVGVLFVIFGFFWTGAGFLMYASDIQLGIAVSGINMIGIGFIMVHLGSQEANQAKEQ